MSSKGPGSQRLCAYGFAVRDGALLLVRASALTEVAGRWFLPGGGVDHGEHPEAALVREVCEETGLEAEVGTLLGVLSDVRTRRDQLAHHTVRLIYELRSASGSLRSETAGSSDLARWVPVDEARDLPLAPYVIQAAALGGLDLNATH